MRLLIVLILISALGACASFKEQEEKNLNIADTNLRLGVGYMQQGRYEEALEKLLRAKDAKPDIGDVHAALALVYERLELYDDADDHYREAIDLEPENGSAYNNYGVFLCRRGKYQEADENFNKALKTRRYKSPERAYENAGACARKIPDMQKAEEYLRKALSINNKLPLALYEMAIISYEKKQFLSTRAYLQRYEQVSQHTAESLWLGIRAERELGDQQTEARYAKLLQTRFPDSLEFKEWLEESP